MFPVRQESNILIENKKLYLMKRKKTIHIIKQKYYITKEKKIYIIKEKSTIIPENKIVHWNLHNRNWQDHATWSLHDTHFFIVSDSLYA